MSALNGVCDRYFHPSLLILSKEGIFFFPYWPISRHNYESSFIAVRPRGSHTVSGPIPGRLNHDESIKGVLVRFLGRRERDKGLLVERSVGVRPFPDFNYFRSYGGA